MNAVKVKGMDPKYTWKIIVIYKAPNEDMMIQRVIEGKIKGGIEVTRRRGRRRRKLLDDLNPLNAELNPICCLLALLGAHHFLHVSRIRVKSLILRLLMLYIYIYIYIYIWSTYS